MGTLNYAVNDAKKQVIELGKFGIGAEELVGLTESEYADKLFELFGIYRLKFTREDADRLGKAFAEMGGVDWIFADTAQDYDQIDSYLVVASIYINSREVGKTIAETFAEPDHA